MSNSIYSHDFVVRDGDGSKVVATRFRNVLGYDKDAPTFDEITKILLSGEALIIEGKFMRPWKLRGLQDYDWMGSWRLERLISDDYGPFFQARQGDDFHECELRIPGFNNHESLIQKDLGPIFLRYSINGPMNYWSGFLYKEVFDWGQIKSKQNLERALNEKKAWIDSLKKTVGGFLSYHAFPNSGRIVIVSAPRGKPSLRRELHQEHLGYRIAEEVCTTLRTEITTVNQVMAFDIYKNDFPKIDSSGSWKIKASMKQGHWTEELKFGAGEIIKNADLAIIIDDTMVSYATQLRIALTIRELNSTCGILCAAVFSITGDSWGKPVSDPPEVIYKIIRDAVKNRRETHE